MNHMREVRKGDRIDDSKVGGDGQGTVTRIRFGTHEDDTDYVIVVYDNPKRGPDGVTPDHTEFPISFFTEGHIDCEARWDSVRGVWVFEPDPDALPADHPASISLRESFERMNGQLLAEREGRDPAEFTFDKDINYSYVDNETGKRVEAYQVDGRTDQHFRQRWPMRGNVYTIGVVNDRMRYAVEESGGKVFAENGDWVVFNLEHRPRKFSDEEFTNRFRQPTDEDIDTSDIPEAGKEFFDRAQRKQF
jgi:hypothetical protein